MDPQNERWPHVDIVRDELAQLQAEIIVSEQKVRTKHFDELKKHMSGYDKTRIRIERRISMRIFTQRMLKYGERVIREREQNGGAVTN